MAALRQEQRQLITQRVDPKLIMANAILQQNSLELEQQIRAEMLENPALDIMEDVQPCQGDCIDPSSCPFCSQQMEARRPENDSRDQMDVEPEFLPDAPAWEVDEDYDPLGNLEAEMTLQEHLRTQLHSALPAADYWIGEYIVENLDSNGWLAVEADALAEELGIDIHDVCRVLKVIQTLDPPGIGARDLQECMLIQLQFLGEVGQGSAAAEKMVRCCFKDVVSRRYARLARVAGVSVETAEQTIEYIKSRLNPHPSSQFRPPWMSKPSSGRTAVRPDVVIRRTEFGYEVEVAGADPFQLGISPTYRSAYNAVKQGNGHVPEDEKKHVTEYVERAELFIRNINQRRKTLLMITRCIIDCQQGFLETGSRAYVRPLTRTRVAQILNVHESTVSRATANKFVQLPNQEVVPFDIFFSQALSVKTAIEEIIASEDPTKPYSDQQIAEILCERGMEVARRTVVKYRESQKILSSTRRRR